MGIRIALGARSGHVLRAIVLPALLSGLTGLALGLGAALAASRLLAGFLFGVETWDPTTYAIVALTMLAISSAATFVPSWRVQSLEPTTILREE